MFVISFFYLQIKIAEDDLQALGKEYEEALNNLKQTVFKEKKTDLKKIKRIKRYNNLKKKQNNSVESEKKL